MMGSKIVRDFLCFKGHFSWTQEKLNFIYRKRSFDETGLLRAAPYSTTRYNVANLSIFFVFMFVLSTIMG